MDSNRGPSAYQPNAMPINRPNLLTSHTRTLLRVIDRQGQKKERKKEEEDRSTPHHTLDPLNYQPCT